MGFGEAIQMFIMFHMRLLLYILQLYYAFFSNRESRSIFIHMTLSVETQPLVILYPTRAVRIQVPVLLTTLDRLFIYLNSSQIPRIYSYRVPPRNYVRRTNTFSLFHMERARELEKHTGPVSDKTRRIDANHFTSSFRGKSRYQMHRVFFLPYSPALQTTNYLWHNTCEARSFHRPSKSFTEPSGPERNRVLTRVDQHLAAPSWPKEGYVGIAHKSNNER